MGPLPRPVHAYPSPLPCIPQADTLYIVHRTTQVKQIGNSYGMRSELSASTAAATSAAITIRDMSSSELTPDDLPEYERPPVVEVALGTQFLPIPTLTAAHVGVFWGKLRDRFPGVEQQPAIAPTIETERGSPSPAVIFQFSTASTLPRTMFLSKDRAQMLQLQADALIHNWRKQTSDPGEYPRYPSIRKAFEEDLEAFAEFLQSDLSAELALQQVEISYINHIAREDVWQTHAEPEKVLRILAPDPVLGELAAPEDLQVHARRLLRSSDGTFLGRLHIDFQPAFRLPGMEPIFVLTLTARGAPLSADLGGVLAFLDLGRQAIVRGFTAITTEAMHAAWRRRR
jgi:uncharacterized protein (TIGR04255 family)